ncbi:MAG: GAF domain-containing protein, partial [Chloroflexota bacterium]|nr:GAF domain-containing protein [Chloroflexota bacterium]
DMVTSQPPSQTWEIVAYEGDVRFKQVRIRENARVQSIIRHVQKHDYVVVLGPPYSEKTRLLHDVMAHLQQTDFYQPVYVNLWKAKNKDEATFFASLAQLISHAPGIRLTAVRYPVNNARAFQNFLHDVLHGQDTHIVFLIDHLHALAQDLVRGLLTALRSLAMERELNGAHQISAIIAGSDGLAGLVAGENAPFNIARQVLVTPISAHQSRALAAAILQAHGKKSSAKALDQIVDWVEGDRYLLPLVCGWIAEAVEGHRRTWVTQPIVERMVERLCMTTKQVPPLQLTIQMIEHDPDTLLDVLDMLQQGSLLRTRARQFMTRSGIDRLQLCSGIVLENGRYRIHNETYRQVLRTHFTPARVGHVLRMLGRYNDVIHYLGPRLAEQPDDDTRRHLLEAIVQSIYAADQLELAYRDLVRGIETGFGLAGVAVYCADPTQSRLRLVYPAASDQRPLEIALSATDQVETQTFHNGDHTLVRHDDESDEMRLIAALTPAHRPIGVVTVEHYTRLSDYIDEAEQRRIPRDLPALLRFLSHAAGAIENVILRTGFQKIGSAVLQANQTETTYAQVLEIVAAALGCNFATLYLLNSTNTYLEAVADVGQFWSPEWRLHARFLLGDPNPAVRCLATTKMQIAVEADAYLDPLPENRARLHTYLRVFIPLRAANQNLGTLEIAYQRTRKARLYAEDHVNLSAFADQVAIAVYNVRLLNRTDQALQRSLIEMHRLQTISVAVNNTLDVQAVLQLIIQSVRELFPGVEATIWQYQEKTQTLRVLQTSLTDQTHRLYRAQQLSMQTPTGEAIRFSDVRMLFDVQQHPAWLSDEQLLPIGMRGFLAMPLQSRNSILGAIDIYAYAPATYTPNQFELLRAFAAQAATALYNAQQYEEVRDKRERDLFDLAKALLHRVGNATGDLPLHLGLLHKRVERPDPAIESSFAHIEHRLKSLIDLIAPLTQLANLADVAFARLDLRSVVKDALSNAVACRLVTVEHPMPVAPVWVQA